MKFFADIRGPQSMDRTDFGDPLTFPLVVLLSEMSIQLLDGLL